MHLFAGHGGGLLADLILGHTPVVAVEWDSYACQVLRERAADGWFPGLRVWEGDVRLFDPSEYAGIVDCIHAGFPCQDLSVAGKQAGLAEGTRSGLYREVLRIAGVVRPRQLFLENVSAIVANGMGTVLGDLAEMGYDTKWLCIRASDVGANHYRDRWFALANANLQHGQWRSKPQQSECESREARAKHSGSSSNVADSNGGRCQQTFPLEQCRERGPQSGANDHNVSDFNSTQREGICVPSRVQTQSTNSSDPCWWTTEPNVGRVANGIPHRVHRLKGLGNAQVPLQAAAAYKLLGGL